MTRNKTVPTRKETQRPSHRTRPAQQPRRLKPGTIALREICRYQRSPNLLIPKSSFQKVVRHITRINLGKELRFQARALLALQHASEDYLTDLFHNANNCAIHAQRVTLMVRDLQLVLRIKQKQP